MTDRELLELAAKAAGVDWFDEPDAMAGKGLHLKSGPFWNPLFDDGDALRLAVRCSIIVEYRREIPACFAYHYASTLEVIQRNNELDSYAATRRAIVRVAAEIGKQMGGNNDSRK